MCRGPLPSSFTAANIASLRVHNSGLQQKPPMAQNQFGENLPAYLAFDKWGPAAAWATWCTGHHAHKPSEHMMLR